MKSNFNIEFSELFYTVKHLQEEGCVFQYFEDNTYDGRIITIKEKKLINFASCSYLGLEKDTDLIHASIDAINRYGTQVASPRAMLSSPLYKKLEEYLCEMFPGFHVLAQTVTLAHCSVLPLLIKENDAIILDAYVHNSLRMASQICKANGTFIVLSRHNDTEHIKYLIKRLRKEKYNNIWYCADGVYSIHGNFCDVQSLNKLLDEEENFYAYVDDAHGTGWCGKNGSGYVIGNFGLHEKMIVVESFAKSMVSCGAAIIVPDKTLADYIRYTGQTMIFSGPIQPSILGGLIECIKLHLSFDILIYQNELLDLIKYFRTKANELNLTIITKNESPIQLFRIGNIRKTYKVLNYLIEKGFFSTTAAYPAIAEGDEGLRVTITRHITKKDIDNFLESLKDILKEK